MQTTALCTFDSKFTKPQKYGLNRLLFLSMSFSIDIEAEMKAAVKMLEHKERITTAECCPSTNAKTWIMVLGMHSNTNSIPLPNKYSIIGENKFKA